MVIKLINAKHEDIGIILQMQKEAFSELYAKYQDTETSPATEKYENILFRFNQPETTYYFIMADNVKVGVIRIVDCKDGVKKQNVFTARGIGSSTRSCRKKATAICMKSSAITKQVKPSKSMTK